MKHFYNDHWELIDPTFSALYATVIFYFWTMLL